MQFKFERDKILSYTKGLSGCYVAGGCLTGLFTNGEINDIDVYPKTNRDLIKILDWAYNDAGLWAVSLTDKAITFASKSEDEPNLQVVTIQNFENANKIFNIFDFTCCMAAFDVDTQDFIFHDSFLVHCSQRHLEFNPNTKFPYASAWRVQKYLKKGFKIGQKEHAKILLACQENPIKSWEDLKFQFGGFYGETIEIDEDKEFSSDEMYACLDTLKYTEVPKFFDHNGFADAVAMTSNDCFDYYYANGKHRIRILDDWEVVSKKPEKVIELDVFSAILGNGLLYKVVKKTKDGEYQSCFKNTFKYKIGEKAIEEGGKHLYCHPKRSIETGAGLVYHPKATHQDGSENVVLEVFITKDDFVSFESNKVQTKGMYVIRECDLREFGEKYKDSKSE